MSFEQQSSTDIVEGKEHDAVSQEEISDIQTEGRITNIKSEKEQVEMKLEITPATEEEVPVNQDKDLSWAEDGLQSPNAASSKSFKFHVLYVYSPFGNFI